MSEDREAALAAEREELLARLAERADRDRRHLANRAVVGRLADEKGESNE
jgi:hypothetical protein